MISLLDIKTEIIDNPNSQPLTISTAKVSFSYTSDRCILKDINFVVEQGKTLAIIGHSGSGKSTITRLLFRFYDATNGQITIDGQDIRQVTHHSLRQAIGVVPQDIVLQYNNILLYFIWQSKCYI